jgi:hypothetical protein
MPDVATDTAAHARRRENWTIPQGLLACGLVLLAAGITGPAFLQLYRAAFGLLEPYMGWWAWTVPVCGEISFTFLFLNGVLLQLRKAPSGGVRALFMAILMAGSALIQVYASHRIWPSIIGHLVVLVAFFGVMLSGKSTIMLLRGGKIRADAITVGEWAAHPVHSFRLWRWMKSWGEPSRDKAQARYMRLLLAIAIAQAAPEVGKTPFRWRRNLPVTLRYELATGYLPDCTGDDWQTTLAQHVRRQLDGPAGDTPDRTAGDTADRTAADTSGGSADRRRRDTSGDAKRGTWPHSRDIDRPQLVRRARAADSKYQSRNGRPIPDARLSEALRVVMSRETAKGILEEARKGNLTLAASR